MPSIRVPISQPFDFHLTVSNQTYYRGTAGSDVYADGVYFRALRMPPLGDKVLVASATAAPGGAEVSLPDGATDAELAFAADAMARMLGAGIDLDGFYKAMRLDKELAKATGSLTGLRPPRTETVFEALVMAVIAQQISSVIARMIRDRMVAAYGTAVEAPDGRALYAFPTPQSLLAGGFDGLRALKLSNRKVEYIQDICAHTLNGRLGPERLAGMEDEAVIEELCAIRGIGRWTAEWMLLRALGRPDVLPAGDLALRKVVSELYFNGDDITEKQLAAFALERWSPYRGLVTIYLFAHLRQRRIAAEVERAASAAVAPRKASRTAGKPAPEAAV
ncbi:MAG: DNA-3-methyladenine glycosylase 2 family protein [SAR202 cluster bacterium]|nr:DNA-3-methyladenine glycosylase 2 family protein [SAR202 cluster bacterium]